MGTVTNLQKKDVDKIQIDEGVIIIDYDEPTERRLGPTRGGGEFKGSVTIRQIEFDGRSGKTAGMEVIEEQEAYLKVNSLCCSQDDLKRALPGAEIDEDGTNTVIKNPRCGLIPDEAYCKNITMFAKLLDGKYKKITILKGLNESGLGIKAAPKAENELTLEMYARYTIDDLNGDLYKIEEVAKITATQNASA